MALPQAAPSHIVGVGASAGGLEPLEAMFGSMPTDSGMAFVVQQHGMSCAIGLALVRSIATAHGGRVDAHSAGQGRGAELSVWLPLDHSAAKSNRAKGRRSQLPRGNLRGLRVLVVEDQDDNRELLELGLQRHGMIVTGAANVGTARALLDAGTFDVGEIDIGLPDERGHEVARYVRQRRTPNMLLIALTGHGQQSERDSIIQAGFNHHVVKPCEISKICQLIAESHQRMRTRAGEHA